MDLLSRGTWQREVLGGAAVGALAGGALSLASRGWGQLKIGGFRIGGEGWFAGWTLPSWVWLVAVGAALGVVIGLARFVLKRRRSAGMSQVARDLGLQHEPEVKQSDLMGGDELFAHWTSGCDRYHGSYRGTAVDVVDVVETWQSTGSDGHDHKVRRTIALLPAEHWPQFRLDPKTIAHRIASGMGLSGISFDVSQLGSSDAQRVRAFQRRWHLAADENPSRKIGNDATTENERAVRRLFTPILMESLNELPPLGGQVRADRLLVWRKKGFLAPHERARLLDDALRLRESLLAGLNRADANRDEPLRADDPYRRAQRSAGAAVGAVAGLMLGFIGGFLIFVGLMQSRGPDAGIGMFFLMPLLAFGGAAVMVIVGALTGRRFSRFIPLPKAADGSHLKATAWRGFGTFVGFAVGGFIGMQIDRLVGGWIWPESISPPWFDIPVLFGCVLAGAFAGWRVGCLIEVRRGKSRPAAPSSTDGPATSEA